MRLPPWLHWTISLPAVAVVALAVTWGREAPALVLVIEGVLLIASVLAAVQRWASPPPSSQW